MLDDSDTDQTFLVALFTVGPLGWIAILLAIAVAVVVAGNKSECGKKSCPDGQAPRLMDHECLCVTVAK